MPIYVNSSQSPFLDAKYFCIKFCRLFSAIYGTEPKTRNGEIKRRTENRSGHDQKKTVAVGVGGVSPGEEMVGCGGKDLQKRKVLSLE